MSDTCVRGHTWEGNRYERPNGTTLCKLCRAEWQREYRQKLKAASRVLAELQDSDEGVTPFDR